MQFVNLANQLWNDDCGGIITSEYLILGSVLTLGTVQGMSTLRDSTNQDLQEMGSAVRETRQHYTAQIPTKGTPAASTNAPQTPPAVAQTPAQCPGGLCP